MPPVPIKQKATGPAKTPTVAIPKKQGVLSRIVDINEIQKGMKLNIYGQGKTGKTRLACSFPKPLLLIGSEDGTSSINPDGVKYVRLQESLEILELVELLQGGQFKTVVLDTAGGLQDLIIKAVLGLDEIPLQRTYGMVSDIRIWGGINSQTKEYLSRLLKLTETHAIHCVIIAHEKVFKVKDDGPSIAEPWVASALTPDCSNWLNGQCDYICNAAIEQEYSTLEQEVNGQKVTLRHAVGTPKFALRIGPRPIYKTGFRVRPGIELPDLIIDPTYEKLVSVINGKFKQ